RLWVHGTERIPMADTITGESNKDRAKLAREAGIGKLSLLAVLAGAVTAFGSFAILLALVSAIAGAVGANTDFGTLDWRGGGDGGGPPGAAPPARSPSRSCSPACSAGTSPGGWPGGPAG